jgi:endonuclease YncB( thermonuclease family)
MAEVEQVGRDRYGRVLGRVRCAGRDAAEEQLRAGFAWVYDDYVTDRAMYGVEAEARNARRGLWAGKAPVPPWEWRRARR